MTLLITGGTGFLGPIVAEEYLLRTDESVILLDKDVRDVDLPEGYMGRVTIISGDVTDFAKLRSVCSQFQVDRIAHLAAVADVDVAEKNPLVACDVNVRGTYNILEVCRQLRISRVVCTSTGAVYGKVTGPVKEDAPYNPAEIYGATKVAAEVLSLQYFRSYGIDVVVDRLYFLYGPGMFFEPISAFGIVKNAVEGKPTTFKTGRDQLFEFTYVRDAATGVVLSLLADAGKLSHRVFNISTGQAISLEDFAHIVRRFVPTASIELGPGQWDLARGFPLDVSLARIELGYEPRTKLEDGVGETIRWLRTQMRKEMPR